MTLKMHIILFQIIIVEEHQKYRYIKLLPRDSLEEVHWWSADTTYLDSV